MLIWGGDDDVDDDDNDDEEDDKDEDEVDDNSRRIFDDCWWWLFGFFVKENGSWLIIWLGVVELLILLVFEFNMFCSTVAAAISHSMPNELWRFHFVLYFFKYL